MRRILVAVLLLVTAMPVGFVHAAASSCAEEFEPVVGVVSSAVCDSDALGGITPFSYYIPAACTATARCSALYLLHGFGGDHTSMLGTAAKPSTFVRALAGEPGTEDDLDIILVAPHGRTVSVQPGAPPVGLESFWVDWNPRYTENPPRFEEFVANELRALVDRSFPTIATREGRAIDGVSLGGFGSFKLALQHPDLYVNAGSISGALNILVAPGPQPMPPVESVPPAVPVELPYERRDRVITTPPGFPFGDPFHTFGDPATDEAYFRGNNPLDLALNATGLGLRFFHNDGVTRDPARDLANPGSFFGAQALELAVAPMNVEMVAALRQHGHPFEHELHPGLHSGPYWDPYIRGQLEWHAARLAHAGGPKPAFRPSSFDYRSTDGAFSVWGWDVTVEDRQAEQFLTLWNASREGVTVVGSGRITIVSPPLHAIGVEAVYWPTPGSHSSTLGVDAEGRVHVSVDLGGASSVTDERAGQTGIPSAERRAEIRFLYE